MLSQNIKNKNINDIFYKLHMTSKSTVYFTLITHLNLDYSHFNCSIATCGYMVMILNNLVLKNSNQFGRKLLKLYYYLIVNNCLSSMHTWSNKTSIKLQKNFIEQDSS